MKVKPDLSHPWVICVLNRHSRNGAAVASWQALSELLAHRKIRYKLLDIGEPALDVRLAMELKAQPAMAILGMGGDGTHMSIINAIMGVIAMGKVSPPPYLPVPFGTGNNVAKSLGLGGAQHNWQIAIDALLHGSNRYLDLGIFEHTWFADAISVGLDADILASRDRLVQKQLESGKPPVHGYTAYAHAAIRNLFCRRHRQCEIILDDEHWYSGPYTNILINNTRIYAGILDPTGGRDDDGMLDALVTRTTSAYTCTNLLSWRFNPTFLKRRGHHQPGILHGGSRLFENCHIHLDPPAPMQMDGEYWGVRHELAIDTCKQVLTVRVPANAAKQTTDPSIERAITSTVD